MRTIIAILLFLFAVPAVAADPWLKYDPFGKSDPLTGEVVKQATYPWWKADPWTGADIARQAAYTTLHAIDWKMTQHIAENPDHHAESNKILGEHPSVSEVNRYFAITGLLHAGVSHFLPSKYRRIWQYTTITFEAGVVSGNYRLRGGFHF